MLDTIFNLNPKPAGVRRASSVIQVRMYRFMTFYLSEGMALISKLSKQLSSFDKVSLYPTFSCGDKM